MQTLAAQPRWTNLHHRPLVRIFQVRQRTHRSACRPLVLVQNSSFRGSGPHLGSLSMKCIKMSRTSLQTIIVNIIVNYPPRCHQCSGQLQPRPAVPSLETLLNSFSSLLTLRLQPCQHLHFLPSHPFPSCQPKLF